MTQTFRGHFDGKVIVPDEPVALPQGTPLTLRVEAEPVPAEQAAAAQRQAALEAFVAAARARPVPPLPDAALRRESIYEDCGKGTVAETVRSPDSPASPLLPGTAERPISG